MKTELILKSDVLDIVFENRNKAYGAYDLRKFYDNRLIKSIGVMILIVMVFSAFTFIHKKVKAINEDDFVTTYAYVIPKAKNKPKEPEKPKEPQQPKQKALSQIFTNPVIVATIEAVKPLQNLTDTVLIAGTTESGKPGDYPVIRDPGDVVGGEGTEPAKLEIAPNIPRETADFMPSYHGGMDALRKFLEKNLINPSDMEENEGVSVKVKFVVGYDGKLQSFVIVQDGGEEFNKEVIRVLKKMPDWVPGKSNGQNVSVYFTIPIKFVSAN